MVTKLTNGKIISDGKCIEGRDLYFNGQEILAVTERRLDYESMIDAEGCYVSAGFIDMHVHGGGGYDFMDGGVEPIVQTAKLHLQHGTTSILPTTLACSTSLLKGFLADLKMAMDSRLTASHLLGAHLEGPYFSPQQSGAQNPNYIKTPDPEEYEELLRLGQGVIKRWSFAPELEGADAFCKRLVENGVVPSIAHSDAVLEDVQKVHELGCRLVTHLYSGMSTITRVGGFRTLGVVESAYYFDDLAVEVIADGKHLPPELLRLVVKGKGLERVCLVTDAMRGAGEPDGPSFLGRKEEAVPCIIEDGVAKLLDRSAFAGSVATADKLIHTMVEWVGLSVPDAVKMMTVNPAKVLGLEKKGDIKPGFAPDLVIFDGDIQVKRVIVDGAAVTSLL